MKILITGAAGFIGSHLVEQLKEHEIYAIIKHSVRPPELPDYINPITADLLDIHSLKKAVAMSQPEIVVHLAAMTPVRYSFNNPFIYAQTNYIGTMNMVHVSLESPVLKKFIFASTAETYKPTDRLLKETDELSGSTPYGVSKVAADLYVRMAGKCLNLPFIIMRPSNTYGRKTEKGYLVEKVVTTMLNSDKLVLDGSPSSVRDYMYIDDHVRGYVAAINIPTRNDVFNISTGVFTSVGKLVDIAAQVLDWHGKVFFGGKERQYDPESLVLDNSKAKELLKWSPVVKLEDGIKKVADYWRDKDGEKVK